MNNYYNGYLNDGLSQPLLCNTAIMMHRDTMSDKTYQYLDKDQQLELLRDILLRKDRAEVRTIKDKIENQEELAKFVEPIVDERLRIFREEFPNEFREVVRRMIREETEGMQDTLMTLMYPVLGKMVRKFIAHQFVAFREQVEQQIKKNNPVTRVKRMFANVNESDAIVSNLATPVLEEVYVIERYSGILLAKMAQTEQIHADGDTVAGMFTAIKSFVEDAFRQDVQELESIEYENYQIFAQSFHTYYIAVAVKGTLSRGQRSHLRTNLLSLGQDMGRLIKRGGLREELEEHLRAFMTETSEEQVRYAL